MLANGQDKAADISSLLMVNSIAAAFKSLLRPSELISQDKGPAESLTAVINDAIADVDKVCNTAFFIIINLIYKSKIRF